MFVCFLNIYYVWKPDKQHGAASCISYEDILLDMWLNITTLNCNGQRDMQTKGWDWSYLGWHPLEMQQVLLRYNLWYMDYFYRQGVQVENKQWKQRTERQREASAYLCNNVVDEQALISHKPSRFSSLTSCALLQKKKDFTGFYGCHETREQAFSPYSCLPGPSKGNSLEGRGSLALSGMR